MNMDIPAKFVINMDNELTTRPPLRFVFLHEFIPSYAPAHFEHINFVVKRSESKLDCIGIT